MTFLYPSFLWALAVLSIPVIIHLFNFRRTIRVYFSNNRFLKHIKEVTTAKRKLKHYLILAARLLFLFFLVITFAQPLIPAREQLDADRRIVLYLDNSQSMSAQLEDNTHGIERSLSFAQSIVDVFPPDTRYKILTNDFAPFSNSYKTKPEAMDILAQVRLSGVSRNMEEVKSRIDQEVVRAKNVFWISDFQKSTIGKVPDQWDSLGKLHLVPIEFENASNVFVDTAYLQNPFSASEERNVLTVKLRNESTSEADQLNVKLTINGIQAGTATVDIPSKGTAETSFDLVSGLKGLNRGQISFADVPVTFDNDFFVALNFTEKVNIVEIKSTGARTAVENVFGNQAIFNFRSYSVDNFNYSLLEQAELVVLNGLNVIEPSLTLSLRNYLSQKAGALLLIPGTTPDAESYKQLTGLNIKVLSGSDQLSELDKPDFSNPFFENVFEERSSSLAMPKGSKFLDWGSDRSAILNFKNDQPFLSRFSQGGKLYLLASPLTPAFTDFYNHALFVPVMYRIAASGKANEARLYFTLQETFIRIRMDSLRGDEPIRLAGSQEVVPAQRRVNNEVFLDIPKFSLSPGFYTVVADQDSTNLLAFNLDKAESLLDQFSANQIKEQMGNGGNITIFEAGSGDAFNDDIKTRYLGKPLWKFALMLSLLFLLVEVLLVRFLK
ncbi:MAG TPA: VWA domain-containing protein [Chryseosolibacter sp.]|nr:VWA domain-containing protein [Chryseosolibacter sp.]